MMIRWQPNRRPAVLQKRARRIVVGGLTMAALTGLALSAVMPVRPVIVYNASASVLPGYYRVLPPSPYRISDLVLVRTPEAVRNMAAARHYIPKSVPMMKHIAALSGDEICAQGAIVTINGGLVVRRQSHDHLGRPLPWWTGCRRLIAGEVFLLNANAPDSFDGRYFGVVPASRIIGQAAPL